MGEDITTSKVQQLLKLNDIDAWSITQLYSGFNRKTYNINNEYILKININTNNDSKIINEVEFYKRNGGNGYYPRLIKYDFTKKDIPYIYTIEEKLNGEILFDVWARINNSQRIDILNQLLAILQSIHTPIKDIDNYGNTVKKRLEEYILDCTNKKVLTPQERDYLNHLKDIAPTYFDNVKMGYIHGDVHFNNILCEDLNIKMIDFEAYKKAPIDLEFDSIHRMVRNPNSYVRNGESNKEYDPKDYAMIMDFFKQSYPSICNQEGFDERIIIYDCLNSLKWFSKFPTHQIYRDVLFSDTKRLMLKK